MCECQETFGTSCWTRRRTRPATRSRRFTREKIAAYGILYRWFTDVSGLGFAEQARMLVNPSPPKREEDLAEHVEMRQDKLRRLAAHGEEFKLAPLFRINALRMLMTGKAKEYFDLWEADHDTTNAKKTYRSC